MKIDDQGETGRKKGNKRAHKKGKRGENRHLVQKEEENLRKIGDRLSILSTKKALRKGKKKKNV